MRVGEHAAQLTAMPPCCSALQLEGQLGDDIFFDVADEMGILVLAGWSCCDAFQHWPAWTPAVHAVAVQSLTSQVRRLRGHASMLVFLYGSDEGAPPDVEKDYLLVFSSEAWPNALLFSAADDTSTITGPTGVKVRPAR